ncbi:MAG: GGDEF domain-containing protein [Solobacterium sp.]|jgi:diguanylate cyclase (GGDEF)-like protein|nr:GGDEF domain-containing protein [Solobacterium sp.]MCH4073763.1 GGDEF domain-containing protein [Solobacterium sp.]
MLDEMILFCVINLSCMVILITIQIQSRDLMPRYLAHDFNMLCSMADVTFVMDMIWEGVDKGFVPFHPVTIAILWYGYFMAMTITGFYWYVYTQKRLGRDPLKGKQCFLRSTLFIWMEMILAGVSLSQMNMTDYMNGSFYHEVLYLVQYILAYAYVVSAALVSWKASRREEFLADRDLLRRNIILPIIPAAAGILQYFFPAYPVLCCAIVLLVDETAMMTSAAEISIDSLTQLNNRRCFISRLQHTLRSLKKDDKLYLLMLDIDYFKRINDTYGHVEGDKALCVCAEALREAAGESNGSIVLARYGGDEFMASLVCHSTDSLVKLENNIRKYAYFDNENSGARYPLRVSIGHVQYLEGMGAEELLKKADEALYAEKRMHHGEGR